MSKILIASGITSLGFSIAGCALTPVSSLELGDSAGSTEPAPSISIREYVQAPDGAPRRLEDLRGQVVILEFWATWCVPCVAAIPHLNELAEHFKDHPVQFIAITNEDRGTIERFLEKREMNAWVALDDERMTFDTYKVTSIPLTVVIDRSGQIAAFTKPRHLDRTHIERVLAGEPFAIEQTVAAPGAMPIEVRATAGVDPAEAADEPPLFQVLIRASQPPAENHLPAFGQRTNAITMDGVRAESIIRHAYFFPEGRVEIEPGIADGHYAFVASAPPGLRLTSLRPLIQQAVVMAFDIETVRERRTTSVLVLDRYREGEAAGTGASSAPESAVAHGRAWHFSTTWDFARMLETLFRGTLVEDETGLDNMMVVSFTYDDDGCASQEDRLRGLAKALREQAGLDLYHAERELEYLIIRRQSKE